LLQLPAEAAKIGAYFNPLFSPARNQGRLLPVSDPNSLGFGPRYDDNVGAPGGPQTKSALLTRGGIRPFFCPSHLHSLPIKGVDNTEIVINAEKGVVKKGGNFLGHLTPFLYTYKHGQESQRREFSATAFKVASLASCLHPHVEDNFTLRQSQQDT